MESTKRPFAAGSRQAPDPYDQFLEREGYYRKHTARDSTCLFRVVSEQVFDVQMYHEKVRADCINFMRKRRDLYQEKINDDYNEYLDEMSKIRSYGTFIELNALAHVYRRNVLLFERYNCGTWLVRCNSYKATLMVFFSPDNHFDSIFPTSFVEQAAYCQGLVYEILYVRVFKLPDVMYSVERMLHDPDGRTMRTMERKDKTGDAEEIIVTFEGRVFVLDNADATECVLDNYRLCHFHNNENFAHIVDIYRNKGSSDTIKAARNISTNCGQVLLNPMLSEKKMSCVRQLLKDGITPFPYKVAKALDPNIYRNIEYDSWSDIRREIKYRNWYFKENGLQVGDRCLVQMIDDESQVLHGYIQEMKSNNGPYVVYIEELAESRTISYNMLQTVATEQMRVCGLSYKPRNASDCHHIRATNEKAANCRLNSKIIDMSLPSTKMFEGCLNRSSCESDKTFCYFFNRYHSILDKQPPPIEMVVMPFISDNDYYQKPTHTKTGKCDTATEVENMYCSSHGSYDALPVSIEAYNSQLYCYSYSDSFPYNPIASNFFTHPFTSHTCGFVVPDTYPCDYYGPAHQMANASPSNITLPSTLYSNGVPNFNAALSIVPNGSDLPLDDLVTLRYYFNIGIDYFRQNQFRMLPPPVPLNLENENVIYTAECSTNHLVNVIENKFYISSNE